MAIDFPTSPTLNQQLVSGNNTWQWDGTKWNRINQTIQGTTGQTGAQGIQGRSYIGVTSSTSLTIGTGSKAFTVTNSGAFTLGERVRAANTANTANYMEGVITAVSLDSSVTINVDVTGGSGTIAAWTFSVSGDKGIQGLQGTQGLQGLQGLQGISNTIATANTVFIAPIEDITVSATAATGTIQYDAITQSVLYYTSNATANFTLNFRGNSGTTLNTLLATGQQITCVFLNTNGTTAYYASAITIDGTSVTPKWQNGTAAANGNPSAIDAYSYTIIKTAASTYTVLATQVKFA